MHFQYGIGLMGLATAVSLASANATYPAYAPIPGRAEAVWNTFQLSWKGYYEHAFPHDSLLPETNSYTDDRNGWGASAIDAFSTALVMEHDTAIRQILNHVQTIDFDKTDDSVSLFETTIRYLGGLLSAYDLLQGPFSKYATNRTAVDQILTQAKHLADNLKVAFDTPTGIPDNNLLFGPPRITNSTSNSLATIGTLILEWTRLSDLTGDLQYQALAEKAQAYLLHPQPQMVGEPFPGLLGTNVDIRSGKFLDSMGSWGASSDSFYEYLLKMYIYDPKRFGAYKPRWMAAADSTMQYLASNPASRPELTFLASYENRSLIFQSEHLACFAGGNFILGGLTFDEPRYVQFGLDLVASCHETYISTASGIGPERFQWQDSNTETPTPPTGSRDFAEQAGFWATDSAYLLRPEVLESYYYAYRATGDPEYQEWAWQAFLAINKTCAVGSGYSAIRDVTQADGGGMLNFQESFWFAEVLKYSFLIQTEDSDYQVQTDHMNTFVFNTESHPLRIPGGERH